MSRSLAAALSTKTRRIGWQLPLVGPCWANASASSHDAVRHLPLLPPGKGARVAEQGCERLRGDRVHAASASARLCIKGWMRWPNCSMPITKSSNVNITPRTPGTSATWSSIRATAA